MVSKRTGFSSGFLALAAVAVMACGDESDDTGDNDGPSNTPADATVGATTPDAATPYDAGTVLPNTNTGGETFFRADTLKLLAPNMVAKPLGVEVESTADAQKVVDTSLTTDENKDGKVDLSLLIRFLNSSPKTQNGETTTGGGLCPFPVSESAACSPEPVFPFQAPALKYTNGTDCKLEDTSEVAAGSCFMTTRAGLTMVLPLIGPVPLQDGQVIGSWQGNEIVNGKVRGFLPKTVAQQTKLPDPVPDYLAKLTIKPNTPLTDFLSDSRLQVNKEGVEGWWFLISFTAKPAKFKP